MIVVDTNIISYLYLSGERSQQAEKLLSLDPHWCAPVLWRSEFRSVLGQYLRKNLLTFEEVFTSVLQGEIIEEYPKDKPFPSCLVYGMNMKREPIHSVWGYNPDNKWTVLITVYRPDPSRWVDFRTRRGQ